MCSLLYIMNQHIQIDGKGVYFWLCRIFCIAAITIIRKVIKDDLVSFYLWPILEWMFKLMIHLKHFRSDWSNLKHFWSVWFCWNHQQSSRHRRIRAADIQALKMQLMLPHLQHILLQASKTAEWYSASVKEKYWSED